MIHLNVVESTYFAAVTDKNIYNGSIGSDEEAISVIRCKIYNVYCIYIFVSEEFERGGQERREIVKRYVVAKYKQALGMKKIQDSYKAHRGQDIRTGVQSKQKKRRRNEFNVGHYLVFASTTTVEFPCARCTALLEQPIEVLGVLSAMSFTRPLLRITLPCRWRWSALMRRTHSRSPGDLRLCLAACTCCRVVSLQTRDALKNTRTADPPE